MRFFIIFALFFNSILSLGFISSSQVVKELYHCEENHFICSRFLSQYYFLKEGRPLSVYWGLDKKLKVSTYQNKEFVFSKEKISELLGEDFVENTIQYDEFLEKIYLFNLKINEDQMPLGYLIYPYENKVQELIARHFNGVEWKSKIPNRLKICGKNDPECLFVQPDEFGVFVNVHEVKKISYHPSCEEEDFVGARIMEAQQKEYGENVSLRVQYWDCFPQYLKPILVEFSVDIHFNELIDLAWKQGYFIVK